jgi:hypothetical protein
MFLDKIWVLSRRGSRAFVAPLRAAGRAIGRRIGIGRAAAGSVHVCRAPLPRSRGMTVIAAAHPAV